MIKVSVLYPHADGRRFDMDYFVNRHLPLVDQPWGPALLRREIDAGLSGAGPGTPPPLRGHGPSLFRIAADVLGRLRSGTEGTREGSSRFHRYHAHHPGQPAGRWLKRPTSTFCSARRTPHYRVGRAGDAVPFSPIGIGSLS